MNQYLEIILMFVKAFLVGGAICLIAQVIINFTKLTAGKILVYFMLAGVVLQALGLYQYLVDFAGAGATVPISGFGYLLANGAIRGAQKGLFYACLLYTSDAADEERGFFCDGNMTKKFFHEFSKQVLTRRICGAIMKSMLALTYHKTAYFYCF